MARCLAIATRRQKKSPSLSCIQSTKSINTKNGYVCKAQLIQHNKPGACFDLHYKCNWQCTMNAGQMGPTVQMRRTRLPSFSSIAVGPIPWHIGQYETHPKKKRGRKETDLVKSKPQLFFFPKENNQSWFQDHRDTLAADFHICIYKDFNHYWLLGPARAASVHICSPRAGGCLYHFLSLTPPSYAKRGIAFFQTPHSALFLWIPSTWVVTRATCSAPWCC